MEGGGGGGREEGKVNPYEMNVRDYHTKRQINRTSLSLCTEAELFIVPRFRERVGTLNLICLSVSPSLCLSVHHKNFNLGHNFCTITDRALILGMCVPCDKTFPMVPCRDLDCDL